MNQHHRRDGNHKEIVQGLRSRGYTIADISQVDGGCGDILAGKQGRTWLLEIKAPGIVKLTPDEAKFKKRWKGQWAIVTTVQEALEVLRDIGSQRPTYPTTDPCYNYRPGQQCVYGWQLSCGQCRYKQGVKYDKKGKKTRKSNNSSDISGK